MIRQKDREAKKNAGKTPEEIAKEKQDKLDKAVTAIRPAIVSMLAKGVPNLLLTARMAFWKMRYGLTSLSLEGEEVVAKVNPSAAVTKVLNTAKHGDMVLRIIHEVGHLLMYKDLPSADQRDQVRDRSALRDDVRDSADRIQQQRAAGHGRSADDPLLLEGGVGNLGAMADFQSNVPTRQRNGRWPSNVTPPVNQPDDYQYTQMGQQGAVVPDRVGMRPTAAGIVVMTEEGAEARPTGSGGGRTYSQFYGLITQMKAELTVERKRLNPTDRAEIRDNDIAAAITRYSQGRKVDPLFTQNPRALEMLGETSRVIQAEGHRGDAAKVFGPMLLQMAQAGDMTFHDVFAAYEGTKQHGARGLFPPSQKGAVKGMRTIAHDLGLPPVENVAPATMGDRDVVEQRKRQIEFASHWIQSQMSVAEGYDFNDEDSVRAFIEKEFRKKVEELVAAHYGRK